MLKHNYHTHTIFCNHAKSTIEEVVQLAISHQLETIGISEHIHLEGYEGQRRLKNHETALLYIQEVNQLKKKYQGQIQIYCGFETEGIHPYQHYRLTNWVHQIRHLPGVDFMILGHHNYKDGGHIFENEPSREIMEDYLDAFDEILASGNILYVAHPDGYYDGYGYASNYTNMEWIAHRIADIVLKHNIPLGINVNGAYIKRQYPNRHFWEIMKQRGVKGIIELDAHGFGPWREEVYQSVLQMAQEIGIDLVDKLDI